MKVLLTVVRAVIDPSYILDFSGDSMNDAGIKIFIVNLKHASARKQLMEQEVKKVKQLGFKGQFEFFDAVEMHQHPEFERYYNDFWSKVYTGKALSFGEKGCFASHFMLWKKCVELDQAIVVLEDDIEFLDGYIEGMQEIVNSGYEYVRLMGLLKSNFKRLNSSFSVAYKSVSGTQGYYITPSAASKLIAKAKCWVLPVDTYMDRFYVHGVLNILHSPYIIQEQSIANESTIGDRSRNNFETLGVRLLLLFKLNRMFQKVRKRLFAYQKSLY